MEPRDKYKKYRAYLEKIKEHRKLPEEIRESMYSTWFIESRCKHKDGTDQCMQEREIIFDKDKLSYLSDYCYYHNKKKEGKLTYGEKKSLSNPVLKGSSGHGFWRGVVPPSRVKK